MSNTLTPLIDRRAAADLLRVSERTLWSLTKKQEIPHVRIGTRVLYEPEALQRFIERNRCGG